MSDFVPSDVALLDLLRKTEAMTVAQLAESLQVTPTAVRQRLVRLMGQGLVARSSENVGRGRPVHHYRLTTQGRRKTGANFADLAVALWEEIRSIKDLEVRRGLLQRISLRLADQYSDQIKGDTVEQRMRALAVMFAERGIPFEVVSPPAEAKGQLPVLTALACPYPDLAELDRSVCSMERLMVAELMGENVRLSECRLDGASCCTFEVTSN